MVQTSTSTNMYRKYKQAPLPWLSKCRWYVLRLLSGAISSTWLYHFLQTSTASTIQT